MPTRSIVTQLTILTLATMGGHAFGTILGASARFPRMDLATYERLREYVTALLMTRFSSVVVAQEDPAKPDFGDLDVVVGTQSYIPGNNSTRVNFKEQILALLRAKRAVSNGSHFISFAIAASMLDTHLPKRILRSGVEFGSSIDSIVSDTPAVDSDADAEVVIYHQVDVNLAKDDDEMEAMPFYNSYGDLGMILSLIFKTVGMSYSNHSLKIVYPPYTERIERPFHLTASTTATLAFLHLDYDVWKAGFTTRKDIYQWILSSRLANPAAILSVSPKHLERPMYQEFLQHVTQLSPELREIDGDPNYSSPPFLDPDTVIKEALEFFGKAEEYYALARSVELRKALKTTLNGKLIEDVTGLRGSVVGKVMAQVKEMVPPEELIAKPEDEVRRLIEEASRVIGTSGNGPPV